MAEVISPTETRTRRLLPAVLLMVAALYVPRALWPAAAVFRHPLIADALQLAASVAKLSALAGGALLAARSASRLSREDSVRSAWWLLSLFMGCFFAGQLVLSTYEALHMSAPLPSVGDALFLVGYAAMIGAFVRFVLVYRSSGFPLGHRFEHAALVGVAAIVFGAVGIPFLLPIASAPKPSGERFINVAYPVLDLVALVPTLLLLRITWPLRGGRVWRAWILLLGGVLCSAGGDIVFAYATSAGVTSLEPWVDPLLVTSYVLLAFGAAQQDALVRGR